MLPTSPPHIRRSILRAIAKIASSNGLDRIKVLDLGVGDGTYGKLIGQRLKIPASITGVEIWEEYRNPAWEFYDNVVIDDIRNYLQSAEEKFDIVLLVEVLEHFSKAEAEDVLRRAGDLARRAVIVSTPTTRYPQKPREGNPYQEHKSLWTHREMLDRGFARIFSTWMPVLTTKLWPPLAWPLVARMGVYLLEGKG